MTAPGNGSEGPRLRMSTVVGGVGLLAVLDIVLLIVLGSTRSVWWPVGIVLADLAAGWLLVVLTGRQAAGRFRELRDALTGAPKRAGSGGVAGKPGWTFLAALLVFLPGLLTDVVGLILLLPPVQKALGGLLGIRTSGVMVRSTGFPAGAGFPPGFDPRGAGSRGPGPGSRGPAAGGTGSGPTRGGGPESIVVETEGVDDAADDRRGTGDRDDESRGGRPGGATKPPPART